MKERKILLKLGGVKHLGEERWRAALTEYDEIFCACTCWEPYWEIPDKRIHIYRLPRTFLNNKLHGLLKRTSSIKQLGILCWIVVWLLRLFNHRWLDMVKQIHATDVLCSYGDYDKSDLTCVLCKGVITQPITRAYKESRVEYNFLEYHAMQAADTVVLYDIELKKFLEKKYGTHFFDGKRLKIGLDENALPSCILSQIQYRSKLSERDGKPHLVILSFRVDSTQGRERDQSRYYYLDMIRSVINAGIVVHLHCAQYNNDHGINRYEELANEVPEWFHVEAPLEMRHDSTQEDWIHSCEILSRYDLGLLHNIVEQSTVSEFDRINVPHRFFAYEAAHVMPVIEVGHNVVLERMFLEKKCGIVYDKIEDIHHSWHSGIEYYTPSYEEYLKAVFE